MYESFGAREINPGEITFRLFHPDRTRNPWQYVGGGLPALREIRVIGDFQASLPGQTAWNAASAPPMTEKSDPATTPAVADGRLFEYRARVPKGVYEYRYHLTFLDGTTLTISDPCSRYGGKTPGNSGFVIGGRQVIAQPIAKRRPYRELVIYELNIDDFTANYRNGVAPLAAIVSRLDTIKALGCNAIELMPWTSWPSDTFSWGYNPYQYFSVAHHYTEGAGDPSDRLVLLSDLINACHARGLQVIMDGVFNHAEADVRGNGFGYFWLYQTTADSPFVGNFAAHDFFRDLDYGNECTLSFVLDVCKYWIEKFSIDGIRLDNTLGIYKPDDRGHGLPRLLAELRQYLRVRGNDEFALVLEHSWDYGAIGVTNSVGASSCWLDPFRSLTMDCLGQRRASPSLIRVFDAARDFDEGAVPTIYLQNHDHKSFALKASNDRSEWWRMQPYVIALFTSAGAVLVHNGQEYANDYDMPEQGDGRVVPRPIDWAALDDGVGKQVFGLFARLAAIRSAHHALTSSNFHPRGWDESSTQRDADGFGLDVAEQVSVFHRWGTTSDGKVERLYVVLNFSDDPAGRSVAFKVAIVGTYRDLLTDELFTSSGNDLVVGVGRAWGRVLFRAD